MTQQSGALRAEVIDSEQADDELIEAERRVPDVAQYAGGVSSDSQHAALRASVRQLGQLLGEALTRHEGPELLAKVEPSVGSPVSTATTSCTPSSTVSTTPRQSVLARAFTAYFQLVNVTEQLHRWREVADVEESPLTRHGATDRRSAGEGHRRSASWSARCSTDWSTARSSRPIPTEASRRSVLELLRKIADVVSALEDPRRSPAETPQLERRLAELVDLLWQTDELRVVATRSPRTRPGPPSTTCSRSPRRSCRTCWRSWTEPSAPSGSSCRPPRGRCVSAAGPAATATATRTSPRRSPSTSSPCSTTSVCATLIAAVEELLSAR